MCGFESAQLNGRFIKAVIRTQASFILYKFLLSHGEKIAGKFLSHTCLSNEKFAALLPVMTSLYHH